MPNWCSNSVTFTDLTEQDARILSAATEKGELLETFVPTVDEDNWYDEHNEKWGTKWDVCDGYVADSSPNTLDVSFETAWAPPLAGLLAISKALPHVTIGGFYCESGLGFEGDFEFRAGEIITDDYREVGDENYPDEDQPVDDDEPTVTADTPVDYTVNRW